MEPCYCLITLYQLLIHDICALFKSMFKLELECSPRIKHSLLGALAKRCGLNPYSAPAASERRIDVIEKLTGAPAEFMDAWQFLLVGIQHVECFQEHFQRRPKFIGIRIGSHELGRIPV